MKNLHFFTLLAAGVFLAAAIATYQPATHTSGGSYSLTNSYSVTPVTGSLYPDAASPKAVRDTSLPAQSASPITHFPLALTPAFSYTIGKVRLSGDEGTRPFPTELSVTELTAATLPPLDQGMVNVTDYAAGYRMLPDGMVFNGDISIVLPYDSTLLPAGFTPDDIVTYYYDVPSGRWTAIERDSVSTADALVYSKVNHFTDFINAVIKTPEMPETSAYTPTSIKELEAANPLAGTQRIQPPTANASGTANMSYPIEIPQGRQGMQPNLALTYNSSGGNGWLGVGWDISVPSITVETRWGVPRYDQFKESDTYIYEGEQLVTRDGNGEFRKLPHRTNQWTNRLSGHVQFFPRKNEAFDSIVRHGNSPNNYWWSVTHKNGVTDYYGKYASDNSVNNSCVLRTGIYNNEGAIAHWALAESVDPYGNSVRYIYDVVPAVGIVGGHEPGKQIYLNNIQYTGHPDSEAKYSVSFSRTSGRSDVTISANRGFKEVTADKLCKIEVRHGSDIIRRYLFYTENSRASQFKTRLTDVIRVDTAEAEPWCGIPMNYLEKLRFKGTRTNFEYYDAPDPENIFGEEKTCALPSDGVQATFISQGFNGQEGMATALGGTKGKSWSLGGTAAVGVGFDVCMTTISVGGNFDYSRSQSEGALTLIDLDGDGLADKVFKDGKKIYYRKRLPYADSLAFSAKHEIAGLEDFLQETSSTTTWGLQASAGCSFSGSWPTTKSTTSVYFADVNADGLPDLITEDGVLFNTTQRGGNVTFTSYYRILESQPNPNDSLPIVVNSSLPCEDFIFDGSVSDSIACGIEWEFVRFEEFKREDTFAYRLFSIILDSLLNTGEYTARYEYFSVDSANYNPDFLHPNKIWVYHKTVVCEPQPLDPDMDAVKVWVAQKTGRIEIASTIRLLPDTTESRRQSKLVDGVRYTIQYDSLPHLVNDTLRCDTSREIFSQVIGKDDTVPHSHIDTVSVTEGDFVFFRLQSQGSRAFDLVDWQREIRYINTASDIDQYGLNDNLYSSSGDFTVSGPHYFQAHKDGSRADIDVHVKTGNIGSSAMLWVQYPVVGSYTTLPFPIVSNQNQHISITAYPDRSDSIRFYVFSNGGTNWGEVEIRPHIRYRYVESVNNPDTIDYYPPVEFPYNNYKNTVLDSLEHSLFGPLYRGWGQFAYNNNADDNSAITDLIDISTLFVEPIRVSGNPNDTSSIYNAPVMDNNSTQEDVTASYDSQGMFHPLSKNTRWVEMQPESRYWSWVGFGNINYMMRDTVSNTRLPGLVCDTATSNIPEYDHPVPQPTTISGGVEINPKTVRKQNISKLRNYSLSLGIPIVPISTGASWSNGDNRILTDYMDLNGDRYPDVVGEVNVQYTMPWGGIGHLQPLTQHVTGVTSSATSSTGTTYGASYSIPTRGASNTPRNSKISFDGQGSMSASLGGGTDCTSYTFMDVNGDGLPDKVTADGLVALNTGYSFLPYENWNSGVIRNGQSENSSLSIGGSINIAQASISGGVGVNKSENNTTTSLVDFNGDGLPDIVSKVGSGIRVSYNLGNGQWSPNELVPGPANISYGTSYSESANAGVTVGFTLFGFLKITVGVQTAPYNRTFSKDRMQLTDINGDGYPDIVTSDSETLMKVRYNQSGKTNLLKQVTDFTGSTINIDYALSEQDFEKPQRSWMMASVEVNDPCSPLPGNRTLTRFTYEDPHHDRNERMDYGFRKVTTKEYDTDHGDTLYRYTEEEYENRIFNKRGRKTRDCIYDAAHRPYVEHIYDAVMYDYAGGEVSDDSCARSDVYVKKEAAFTNYYEGQPTPQITTAVMYVYDSRRNVVEYTNRGDTTHHDEYFRADITYATGIGYNLVALPTTIEVRDFDGNLLQKRGASYNSRGKMERLVRFNGSDESRYDFSYDGYGNLYRMVFPANASDQRLEYEYKYESELFTYPEQVINVSLGYTSMTEYEYKFGKPIRTTDINGNQMIYRYDYAGRNTVVLAPYEIDLGRPYTIRMEYHPRNYGHVNIFDTTVLHSYANTFHHDCQHLSNPIQTILICDGLGRMLQTKKDAEVEGVPKLLNSGRVEYDCFGRTVKQYHPFASNSDNTTYNNTYDIATLTSTTYDILDRPVKVKLPTSDSTMTAYSFGTDSGKTYFSTTTIDPNDIAVTALTGTRKQQVKTVAPCNAVTTFMYDPLGQLLQSTDPCHHSTYYTYDMLGRMVQRTHPDAGTDTYIYDGAGNMTKHSTQVLSNANKTIDYHYTYNRLDSIVYPNNPQNNVRYTYGDNTAGSNQCGRIALIEDASGFRAYKYGKLGEVTEEHRTFVLPNESSQYSFKTQFEYDSWNRVQNITYPDGEVVRYFYNTGGMLRRIRGEKSYLNTVVIDTFIIVPPGPIFPKDTPDESTADNDTSGNGDRGLYQYYYYNYVDDILYNRFELKAGQLYGNGTHSHYSYDVLHRLDTLKLYDANGNALQDIKYNYDAVGNICSIQNNASIVNALGGRYTYTYEYDSLYRLTEGIVTVYAPKKTLHDTVRMTYYADGRIASKYQKGSRYVVNGPNFNQNVTYTYHTSQPHTADEVGGRNYTWDANGNMLSEVYYDPRNTRIYSMLEWNEENRLQKADMPEASKCAYYLYDADGERFYKNAGSRTLMYQNGQPNVYREYDDPVLYASPYVVATPEGYTKHYFAENERIASHIGEGSFANITTHSVPDSLLVPKQSLTNNVAPDSILPNKFSYLLNPQSNWSAHYTTYWQHADHLGSASYITDTNGVGYQQLMYMPWGEPLLDRHRSNSSYDARYTFSGKERDEETGYSYFGARYYNSDLSIWLSVDPMADKYPSTSPYAYCGNNPVRLVDPNGEEIINPYKKNYDISAKRFAAAQEKLNSFGGNKKAAGYKEARREYMAAKRSYNSISDDYAAIEKTLSEVKKYNPDLYEKMNNLKDDKGNSVDICVYINYSMSKEGHGTVPVSENCPSVLNVSLNPHEAYNNGSDMGTVLSHEFGHFLYIVPNWSKYQDFLGTINPSSHNGHDHGDKSGIEAMRQAEIYRQKKYGY